jgi:hypothetical protein
MRYQYSAFTSEPTNIREYLQGEQWIASSGSGLRAPLTRSAV